MSQAILSVLTFCVSCRYLPSSAMLVTRHKRNCCCYHRADIPCRGPTLFMKICKSGTDWLRDFKSPTWCEKSQFGWRKRIILAQLQNSMIISSLIRIFQTMNTKVEVEQTLSSDPCLFKRLLFYSSLLFLQSQQHKFFIP